MALHSGLQKMFNGEGSVEDTRKAMDAAWDKGSS